MTNPPKCRGTTQHCNESSSPSWLEASSSDFPKQTLDDHHWAGKRPRPRRSSLPSSMQREEQLRLPTAEPRPHPQRPPTTPHPQQPPTDEEQSAPCYRCRATSSTQQLRLHVTGFGLARQAASKRWRATIEDNNQGHKDFQMQRLQGHDAKGAVVARPKWTGFSPLEEDARGGGSTTPPTGKTAPTGVAVVKAFAQMYLSLFQMKRQALMIQLPATTVVEVASLHDYASRGVTMRQLHMAAA